MKPEMDRIQRIFAQVLQQAAAERENFLALACKGEPELRAQVDSLLQAHDQAGGFLARTIQLPEADFAVERTGTMIGRYKLLEKIGEGGFGTVYMAEQVEPVQRKVALKIIKAGMDTREVVARFEAERQALALMDHPNIARVLDAGETEAGRPYFVMELVRGIPITDYCDQKNLSTAERLQLFMKVCHAVQHAHQKGIIHRDLKSNNVLVTLHDGEPVPKVIDFGVAKALGQKLTEKTLFTGFAQMIGTPAYMSPEQAELSGMDIDTRSDIYSLGVLLYELLTGGTPFDAETLRKAALDEVRRMIRETEPLKPSTRLRTLGDKLSEVAKRRNTEPASLSRLVRGDLDWIVMKCLEKDRKRRYETPDALAQDVARHLNNDPVLASPPSVGYLLVKFVRRHKAGLAVAASLLLLLLAGAAVSTWQAVRATRAEREQTTLRHTAELARNAESAERQKAGASAKESHDRLVRLTVANGAHQLEQDLAGALSWFAEAFQLDAGATEREDIHRLRLGTMLRQCPRPVQMWFHADHVNAASFSPDGRWALTSSRDGTARVWDVESGQPVGRPVVHHGDVECAAFSPAGDLVISTDTNGVLVWRPESGEIVHRFEQRGAFYAAFSPDGRLLAGASSEGVLRVWEVGSGSAVMAPITHRSISHLAFSPDSRLLAFASYDGTGQMWDLAQRSLRHELRVRQSLRHLAFSPDGTKLAGADWLNAVYVWDTASGQRVLPLLRHNGMVAHVAFSPDGKQLASSSLDFDTKLWDCDSGALLQTLHHSDFPMESVFNKGGTRLLTRGFSGWINLWDLQAQKPTSLPLRLTSWVTAVDLHPDGRRVLAGCSDGSVRVLDLRPDGALFSPWHDDTHRILGASPDGSRLLTQDRRLGLELWDTFTWQSRQIAANATNQLLAAFVSDSANRLLIVQPGAEDGGTARSNLRVVLTDFEKGAVVSKFEIKLPPGASLPGVFAASADCRHLALGRANTLEVWNAESGSCLTKPKGHASVISVLRFSPDGSKLLVNCGRLVHRLDLVKNVEMQPALTNSLATSDAVFSLDGRWIASCGSDVSYDPGEARVWDATSGALLQAFRHTDGVTAVAFSPDSDWLATASEDNTARVWDLRSGRPVTPWLVHPDSLAGVAFSADGNFLATVAGNGSVRVWTVPAGEPVTPPLGRGAGASQVRFLAGARHLLTNAREGSRLWRLEPAVFPAADLADLGRLFAGHRVDQTGTLEPLPLTVQSNLYGALRGRYPEFFEMTVEASR